MKFIDWEEFGKLCDKLFEQLMMKNYDGVIGIGRGGTVVGGVLAAKLWTRLYSVFVIHKGIGEQKTTQIIDLSIAHTIKKGRYLLVDDKCSTGETFEMLKDSLSEHWLDTASLICTEKGYRPDIYAEITDEEITFPYQ